MTRQFQKDREQFFAEHAARSLGKAWRFDQSIERPDFIVSEAGHRFGLEVTGVFMGLPASGGSLMKAHESKTQKVVNAMRRAYEAAFPYTSALSASWMPAAWRRCCPLFLPKIFRRNPSPIRR
jgi:hypothetical protein